MKAVILAGGKGTRMGKISEKTPKPMIKIGGLPVLEYQIKLLKRYGIKEIIILTSHLSEVIEKYFGNGRKFGVAITYFKEEIPLGTAGAIKEIENELKDDFIVLYGDVMLDADILKLLDFHKEKNSDCTLAVHPNDHPFDSDLVEIDGNQKIIAFNPKPHAEGKYFRNLVNACLYVLSPKILAYVKKGEKADFGKDIFPEAFQKMPFYGYNTAEYFKDMGTSERVAEVRKDFKTGKISRLNKKSKRKAIFLDRDGTINEDVGHLNDIGDFKLIPGAIEAIKKINNSEFLALVITNQPVVARGECTIAELEEIHKKMETLLGREGARLDAIYYCPHYPEKGFPGENIKYKIECDCRKPKIGLIKKAVKDFNIDLKKSYFIGDSWRDIECGKNAGTKTIGVKTGEACKNCQVKPAYFFDDICKAVNFIIKSKK